VNYAKNVQLEEIFISVFHGRLSPEYVDDMPLPKRRWWIQRLLEEKKKESDAQK